MALTRPTTYKLVLTFLILGSVAAAVWTVNLIERPSADSLATTAAPIFTLGANQALPGDPITFTLTNTTASDITLPSAAPYVVRNDTTAVYSPVSDQLITTLKPGETHQWIWNQQDDAGQRVAAGAYTIAVMYQAGTTPGTVAGVVGIHDAAAIAR